MKYVLLIAGSEATEDSMSGPEMERVMGAFAAYTRAMIEAGVRVAGEQLQRSATASTVRVRSGRTEVLDGPYAETKEQLGGFYIIDVPDLDAALAWAARCPAATFGSIEVRPIQPM